MALTLDQKLEAAGCKEVPKDHWIYSEGASTHFSLPTSQPSESKASESTTKTGNESMAQEAAGGVGFTAVGEPQQLGAGHVDGTAALGSLPAAFLRPT